jgi:hypothetical protein
MSKMFFITGLVIFILLQIIVALLVWFSVEGQLSVLQGSQQSIINYLQSVQQAPAAK